MPIFVHFCEHFRAVYHYFLCAQISINFSRTLCKRLDISANIFAQLSTLLHVWVLSAPPSICESVVMMLCSMCLFVNLAHTWILSLHIVLWFVGQIVCDFCKFSGPCPIFHPSLPPPQNMWLPYWYWGYSGKMRGGVWVPPPHLLFVHKSVLVTAAFCLRLFLGMGRVLTDWTPPLLQFTPSHPLSSFFKFLLSFFYFLQ